MNPAFSVVFLTTLIGLGQGLFTAMVLAQGLTLAKQGSGLEPAFYIEGSMIVVGLLALGLLASFFHLGHPERAWRSATMWRTSWLSREVIALPAFMGAAAVYGLIHWLELDMELVKLGGMPISLSFLVGLAGVALSVTLFICTGMIYACIRFLQEWATPLTVINFILFGLASGFTLASAFAHQHAPSFVNMFIILALIFTVLVAITRISTLIRNSRIKPKSTLKSAIGVRHNQIKQISQGAMGGSFNTREYMHGKSIEWVKFVKWSFLVMVFVIPFIFLLIALVQNSFILLVLAVVVQYLGLLAERWFFFAQSNHPQNLYYQAT